MTRGMDVEGVRNVINYDMPAYIKTYIHRAGRTARAGQAGRCFTLLRKDEVCHLIVSHTRYALYHFGYMELSCHDLLIVNFVILCVLCILMSRLQSSWVLSFGCIANEVDSCFNFATTCSHPTSINGALSDDY